MTNYLLRLLDWCKLNIFLYQKESRVVFKEGEIWWCSIGMTVGREIYGKGKEFLRPVLILKKFNTDLFLGIPLTNKHREGSWYVALGYAGRESRAVLNQARTMDKKRLLKRMGVLGPVHFQKVETAFSELMMGAEKQEPRREAGRVGNPKDI